MKLAYVVATPDVLGTDATAYIGPTEPFFRELRRLGYDGVELMIRDPNEVDRRSIRDWLSANSLEVALVNTGRIYLDDGLCLMVAAGETREQARRRICQAIDLAAELGGPGPQINAGLLRGTIGPGLDARQARAWVVENLSFVAKYAADRGVRIALEPINRYQSNFINSAAQAIELAREVGTGNIRVQMDVFHMNIEETSLCGSLIRYREWISHVHVCDTNRQAPGLGHFDFSEIIDSLHALGYEGYVSAELAAADQTEAARLTAAHLTPLLTRR